MKLGKLKVISIAGSAIVLGGLAAPTNAAATRCSTGSPRDFSDRPPIEITNRATKADPIVVRYDQPRKALFMGPEASGDEIDFALQMSSRYLLPRLHVRLEWPTPSVSDIDAYLYDSAGQEVARAEGWNIPAEEKLGANSGSGYEYFATHVGRCSTYRLMTGAWHTPGEKVTMKIWLTRGR